MTPILRSYLSIIVDLLYFPVIVGSPESSMFDTTIGVTGLTASRNGTKPSIP